MYTALRFRINQHHQSYYYTRWWYRHPVQAWFGSHKLHTHCVWALNRRHAAHNTRGRKRTALDATPVCAAVQTKLDVDNFVQHSRNKRLELLEVRNLICTTPKTSLNNTVCISPAHVLQTGCAEASPGDLENSC